MANGVYTNQELVETLIVDLNALPKELLTGQYINACSIVAQMAQKLVNLRDGIKNDIDSKNEVIESLKEQLRNSGTDVVDMTPDEFIREYGKKDGAGNGAD